MNDSLARDHAGIVCCAFIKLPFCRCSRRPPKAAERESVLPAGEGGDAAELRVRPHRHDGEYHMRHTTTLLQTNKLLIIFFLNLSRFGASRTTAG